jgi:glutamate racemase
MKRIFGILSCILLLVINVKAQSNKSTTKSLPIGVFDSGTGGLTVLEAMLSLDAYNNVTGKPGADGKPDFKSEYFQYLADQANMPYGNYAAENKTDLLKEHILKNMQFFLQPTFTKNNNQVAKPTVKMIVLACNTATAYALTDVKSKLKEENIKVPVIGVIEAGAKAALAYQKTHGTGTIGVFATAGTVASEGYPKTLQNMAKEKGLPILSVISQGGAGLAESIDRDWSYFVDTLTTARKEYKGPSLKNKSYTIDTSLLLAYRFDKSKNKLLCEYDDKGSCLDMQLNDPSNYVRYHLVSLLEKMLQQKTVTPMNTLILGCTHYPYLRDTIAKVLTELYNYKTNNQYRYRNCITPHVELIDPSVETAKEAYLALRSQELTNTEIVKPNLFFITIPNKNLSEIKLQPDGWFTYDYKYGRVAGAKKDYIQYVPFDKVNISKASYERFSLVLPNAYKQIAKSL